MRKFLTRFNSGVGYQNKPAVLGLSYLIAFFTSDVIEHPWTISTQERNLGLGI